MKFYTLADARYYRNRHTHEFRKNLRAATTQWSMCATMNATMMISTTTDICLQPNEDRTMRSPISPREAADRHRKEQIPDAVIVAFNDLIVENLRDGRATFLGKTVAERISKATKRTLQSVYDRGWLDVEEFYREVGWEVTYDQPAFNESGEGVFTFTERGG